METIKDLSKLVRLSLKCLFDVVYDIDPISPMSSIPVLRNAPSTFPVSNQFNSFRNPVPLPSQSNNPISITFLLADDIPIQGPNLDPASGLNSAGPVSTAALVSITEESEIDPQQQASLKNSTSRTGKDTPKVHKVPFPAFKKSKDKLTANKSNSSLDTSDTTSASVVLKESSSTTKASHKKDKFANRGSIGISLQMSVDVGDGAADRASPSAVGGGGGGSVVFKRHLDFGTSDMVALQSFSSNSGLEDDHLKPAASGDSNGMNGCESTVESSADNFASDQLKRISVVDMKLHSMQTNHV